MAWVATDNAETYDVGNWHGANGGSGWSAAWVKGGGGVYDIVSTPTLEGSRCFRATRDGGGTGSCTRTLTTGVSAGILQLTIRQANNTTAQGARIFGTTSGDRVYGVYLDSGNIVLKGGDGDVNLLTSFSADTNYDIQIEFDTANTRYRGRAVATGGAFGAMSDWKTPTEGTTGTSITAVSLAVAGTDTYYTYFDNLKSDSTVYTQTFTETLTLTEALTKVASKALTETLSLTENLEVHRLLSIVLSEVATFTEALTKVASKTFSETSEFTENLVKTTTKIFSEIVTLTETLVKVFTKIVSETLELTEYLTVPASWVRRTVVAATSWVARTGVSSSWTNRTPPSSTTWTERDRP